MARRTAKSKAADDSSSQTSVDPGFTMQLRDLLRVGGPTQQYPRTLTFGPSQMPSRRIELESSSTSGASPTLITVLMPTGDAIQITTDKKVTIEFERDFVDATVFNDQDKTYRIDKGSFTIAGKL